MAVIRPKKSEQMPLFFSIRDAEEEAQQIVETGRAKLRAEVEAARREGIEQGKAQGYEAGLAEGRGAGRDAALEEYRQRLADATAALACADSELAKARNELQAQVLDDCVELALAVARRIIKTQVQLDPQVLSANLDAAVKLVIGSKRLRIAFHPHDQATVNEAIAHLKLSYPELEGAKLIEDPALSRGGCRIYTEHGLVDADIAAQLDRLIEQIRPGSEPKS
jgi:flagellar assembly protein FliH